MQRTRFSITQQDEELLALIKNSDQKTLAIWAFDCAERVLPYFEEKYPEDQRPRQALEALRDWINTGVFRMAVIRKASLAAHAAAREVGEDNAARSAARAAGQAVATAHVPRHAYGPAVYARQALFRAVDPSEAAAAITKERNWQLQHLLDLADSHPS
jgi:hypothetical protein